MGVVRDLGVTLFVGSVVSVLANLLIPCVKNFYASTSVRRANSRIKRLRGELALVARHKNDPSIFIVHLVGEMAILVVICALDLALIIIGANVAIDYAIANPGSIDTRMVGALTRGASDFLVFDGRGFGQGGGWISMLGMLGFVFAAQMCFGILRKCKRVRDYDDYKSSTDKLIGRLARSSVGQVDRA